MVQTNMFPRPWDGTTSPPPALDEPTGSTEDRPEAGQWTRTKSPLLPPPGPTDVSER